MFRWFERAGELRAGTALEDDSAESVAAAIEKLDRLIRTQTDRHAGYPVAEPAAPRVAISVQEAQSMLGCGRARIFTLLKSGKLKKARKIGRKTMVSIASIEGLLDVAKPSATPDKLRHRTKSASRANWKAMNIARLRV